MFESYKKASIASIILIVLSVIIFFYKLIGSYTFSLMAVCTFVTGLALLYVIHASKLELNQLRLENIDLRKKLEAQDSQKRRE